MGLDSIKGLDILADQLGDVGTLKTTSKKAVGAANELFDQIGILLITSDSIKGTTQSLTYNTDGSVQKVQHKDSNSIVIREDIFTYATNLITEVRTLNTGSSLTYKYHLDTLQTEVI